MRTWLIKTFPELYTADGSESEGGDSVENEDENQNVQGGDSGAQPHVEAGTQQEAKERRRKQRRSTIYQEPLAKIQQAWVQTKGKNVLFLRPSPWNTVWEKGATAERRRQLTERESQGEQEQRALRALSPKGYAEGSAFASPPGILASPASPAAPPSPVVESSADVAVGLGWGGFF